MTTASNMSASKLTVGSAPHLRTGSSITKLNHAYILALLPAALVGAVAHAFGAKAKPLDAEIGPINNVLKILVVEMGMDTSVLWLFGILGTLALGFGVGALAEYLSQVIMRQPYRATDGHGALMGLLIAMLMPPTVPWWVLVFGVVVAIFVGKQIYGGLGGYPMHPAVVGWLILLLSWPQYLYPVGMASIAAPHIAAVIVTAIGGIALCVVGCVPPQIPVGVIGGAVIATLLFGNQLNGGVGVQLFEGHLMLAAFFFGTDSTCSPANKRARWIFGAGLGFMVILIRAFGIWPDAVPFAVLLMNALNPLIDRLRPRVKQVVLP